MASWLNIAKGNHRAARLLENAKEYRSAVSRYYYAGFSAVSEALEPFVTLPTQRETPSHQRIPLLIERHLPGLSDTNRRTLKRAMRILYEARLKADYRSGITTDAAVSMVSRRQVVLVLQILKVEL